MKMIAPVSGDHAGPVFKLSPRVERLRKNLADFNEKFFQKSRILFLDVTCNRSIETIVVQILENVSR